MTASGPGEFSLSACARPFLKLPPAGAGQRIALFGGSFNPPHKGHRQVALAALHRLEVAALWWLITPGNPLKSGAGLPPIDERVARTAAFASHPRMAMTGFEAAAGIQYTADAIAYARRRCPTLRFVWVMGADNLASLHRWQKWRDILRQVPVAVVDRPGASLAALSAPAARAFARWRVPERAAGRLADMAPPAWVFLHVPLDTTSSTNLRSLAARRGSPAEVAPS